MTGASGADLLIEVAKGTEIRDLDTGESLGYLTSDGDRLAVAKAGRAVAAILASRRAHHHLEGRQLTASSPVPAPP